MVSQLSEDHSRYYNIPFVSWKQQVTVNNRLFVVATVLAADLRNEWVRLHYA
jgi:hypothetical protein